MGPIGILVTVHVRSWDENENVEDCGMKYGEGEERWPHQSGIRGGGGGGGGQNLHPAGCGGSSSDDDAQTVGDFEHVNEE